MAGSLENRSAANQLAALVASARSSLCKRKTKMMQTTNEKIALLRASIKGLRQFYATYDGHERMCCAHILGTKQGQWKVLCWQFDGSSSKPEQIPTWRDFSVERLHLLTSQDGEWHRGWVTGQREQKSVDWIDTVVDPAHAAEIRETSFPRTPEHGFPRRLQKKW
jgi:hypothetical protein